MGPIASLVDGTTNKLIPHQQALPLPLSVLYRVFNRIHRLWHWYRKGTLYANPNNLFQLMAGHSLNIIAGDSRLLRVMAQCVMISTRILEWIEEYSKLIRCWGKWVNELLHYPPVYIREKWNKENSRLSPSIAYYWRVKYRTISHRIKRSMHLTGRICRRMFALSMKSIDAIDSFSMTPDEQRSSINELFFNTSKWIETLANNKETLIIGMKKNQKQ